MLVVQSSEVGCTNKHGWFKNSHDSVWKYKNFQSKANNESQLDVLKNKKTLCMHLAEKSVL
jgi:hypothetical protein